MIDYARIRAMLPHGHPMVLVDRVVSIEPGRSLVAVKAISGSDACYASVPAWAESEQYAYPTSLMLESFGQAAAILWMLSEKDGAAISDSLLLLAAIRNCRVHGEAFPGDVLRHTVRLDHPVGDNIMVTGDIWIGERQIATVDSMIAAVRPRAALEVQWTAAAAASAPSVLSVG